MVAKSWWLRAVAVSSSSGGSRRRRSVGGGGSSSSSSSGSSSSRSSSSSSSSTRSSGRGSGSGSRRRSRRSVFFVFCPSPESLRSLSGPLLGAGEAFLAKTSLSESNRVFLEPRSQTGCPAQKQAYLGQTGCFWGQRSQLRCFWLPEKQF